MKSRRITKRTSYGWGSVALCTLIDWPTAKLPDSLETLVESGIMPARYLKDENERPLKYWREGDFMVVESPATQRMETPLAGS